MPETLGILQNSLTGLSPAVLFIALFLATFVSEDTACVLAGTTAAAGHASYALSLSACLTGIVVGDILLYGIGSILGISVLDTRIATRVISNEAKQSARKWLSMNMAKAVFVSRFVSGLRLPTYLIAGAMRGGIAKFSTYVLIAAAIWTPIVVFAGAYAQNYVFNGNVLFGALIAIVVVRFSIKLTSWKSRRVLLGKLKRIYRWEFWPMAVFYIPVVIYVLLLAVRFRSLTIFTAANPCMPASGFVGESKAQIYQSLSESDAAKTHLLRYRLARAGMAGTIGADNEHITELAFEFPVVAKPDVGERGSGVRLIKTAKELGRAIAESPKDIVIQEYCPGVEASVFYYRFPDESKGHIFSITEKAFPQVVGDGKSSIQQLILRDSRAVCIAEQYLLQNRERLDAIPEKGEQITLVEIGTHSRGAIFNDGDWIRSPDLETTINSICTGIRGFYFGRFDIRSRSFSEMRNGRFRVIELNGVTSESTNIYDRRFSLIDAYRILFAQWKIAFSIGRMNAQRGVKAVPLFQFIRLLITREVKSLGSPDGSDNIRSVSST